MDEIEMQPSQSIHYDNREFLEHERGPFQTNINIDDQYNASRQRNVNRMARDANLTLNNRTWTMMTFRNRNPHLNTQDHVNQIVTNLEQNNDLMQDNVQAEALRKNALRDMPQNLTIKRCVKKQLSKSVSLKAKRKPIGLFKKWKYSLSISYSKFKNELKSFLYTFELWYNTIKKIEGHFGSSVASYFKFFKFLFLLNCFMLVISLVFIVIPQLFDLAANGNTFYFSDIFTGEGYFTKSLLYYGIYSKENVGVGTVTYYMPYGYFFTMLCLYLLMFVIFSVSMAKSYRYSFIETKGGLKNVLSHKIFCGWDFQIDTKETAEMKSASLYQDLKAVLRDLTRKKRQQTCLQKFQTVVMQAIANLFVILLLIGMGYLIWILLDYLQDETKANRENILITLPAIVINLVIIVLPMLFSFIIKYEDYKTERALTMTLFRIFVMQMIIIGVLIVFWLKNSDEQTCWETNLAQEVYRLIIFDFIFAILLQSLIFVIGKHFLHKLNSTYFNEPDFNIALNVLNIIYNQALLWIGFFFSPLLPVVVIIKMLITFYIQSTMVLHLCQPSSNNWRASNASVLFYILSFISLFAMIAVLGYILFDVSNSKSCGPFTENIIKEIINGAGFWNVILFIVRPGVLALVLIALIVAVYFQYEKSKAHSHLLKILKEMQVWQAKDKEFLLKHIAKITNGKWQYKVHQGRQDLWNPVTMTPVVANSQSDDENSDDLSCSGELILNPKKNH